MRAGAKSDLGFGLGKMSQWTSLRAATRFRAWHTIDMRTSITTAAADRILVLDGAMGSLIQGYKLGEADFRGDRFADHPSPLKGNNDLLALTRPDVLRDIHNAYFGASH